MTTPSSRTSAPPDLDFADQRAFMVSRQLEAWGVHDARVLEAMGRVPREAFVPPQERAAAYYDGALPIGEGQTISQPYIVARMSEALGLQGHERVLEIGTGSGYQAAVLSCLAREVYTVERIAALSHRAQRVLDRLQYGNVFFRVGDGSLGWPDHAPYDAIVVTCAAPAAPPPLIEQLAEGGRLVAPLGPHGNQTLVVMRKQAGAVVEEVLLPVAFVPLIGVHGW